MDTQELRALIITELCRIAPEIEPELLPENEDLRDAVDLDSMDFLRLVAALSKQTGIIIPEADYPKIMSLAQMTLYLQQHVN